MPGAWNWNRNVLKVECSDRKEKRSTIKVVKIENPLLLLLLCHSDDHKLFLSNLHVKPSEKTHIEKDRCFHIKFCVFAKIFPISSFGRFDFGDSN